MAGPAGATSMDRTLAASASNQVAIDPFQAAFDDVGLQNIERLGLAANLEFYRDHSHAVLPRLLESRRRFDFAFIDGGHRFDEIFVDVYYADLLLARGGYLLLHDTWMRSTCLVERARAIAARSGLRCAACSRARSAARPRSGSTRPAHAT